MTSHDTPSSVSPTSAPPRCIGFWGWLLGHRYQLSTSRYEDGASTEYVDHRVCARCGRYAGVANRVIYFRNPAANV